MSRPFRAAIAALLLLSAGCASGLGGGLPGHQRGSGCPAEALLAGHETRGDPREEHREPREDERDHELHGGRRGPCEGPTPPSGPALRPSA